MGVVEELRERGVARGDLVALVVAPGVGVAMATPAGSWRVSAAVEDLRKPTSRSADAVMTLRPSSRP
jgi:hypothetical protein